MDYSTNIAKILYQEKIEREESSVKHALSPLERDARAFSQNDGDAGNKHLSLKVKKSESGDRMRSIPDAYNSGNYIRRT